MADNNAKIDSLLAKEEPLRINAVAKTMQAYNQNPTIANLKDWDAAKKALEEYRIKKAAELNPQDAPLKGIMDVLQYLQSEGWKISKSKLYEDENKIDKQKDGNILKKDADKYAAMFLRKLDGSDYEIDPASKIKEETRLTKERADKVAFENEIMRGDYVLREEVEQQLAARAAYLKNSIEGFFHSLSPRIAELVNGDQDKIPELTEFCLREVEDFFHHYSKPLVFEAVKLVPEDTNAA